MKRYGNLREASANHRPCQADRERWAALTTRVREVAALHDGPVPCVEFSTASFLRKPFSKNVSIDSLFLNRVLKPHSMFAEPWHPEAMTHAEGTEGTSPMAQMRSAAAPAETLAPMEFSFEVSPHTSRLHPFRNQQPLGLSLREDDGEADVVHHGRLSLSELRTLVKQAKAPRSFPCSGCARPRVWPRYSPG